MSLRTAVWRRIREWLERLKWRRSNVAAVSRSLALDVGVPPESIDRIIREAMTELRDAEAKGEAADAWPIINKAINEIGRYGCNSHPSEVAIIERYLDELPERDFSILCQFQQGKKHRDIAALMRTDVESVRCSLVKTYANLRMRMINSGGGGGVRSGHKPAARFHRRGQYPSHGSVENSANVRS